MRTSTVRRTWRLFIGAVLVACVHAHAGANAPRPADDLAAAGPFAVQTLEFPDLIDATRGRKVPIKVHVPATGGPFPVVVVSHGAGGHWDANFAQARHLASHGYVVLAVEHVGSNTEVMKRSFRFVANLEAMTRNAAEVLGRPKDIGFAIDRAEEWNRTHEVLRGRLDVKKVGVLGHSFGAYTTLVVAGMRPALDWLKPPVGPGHGLGPDLRDTRVACGVALSPQGPGEPFFIESSYASLQIPLLGISGSEDKQQRDRPENRRRAFELWPPGEKYLVWLAGADHLAFSDSTGSKHVMLPSRSRSDVQPVVRAATLLFFDACLKNDAAARQSLTAAALRRYWRGEADGIEVLHK
ncbi:MAG TPA: dienelactone hydrolase family protein [Burkholderiaceae bacterium]|nr:dienelactone hydrolase family protein [Burkholderiaceae bacterium]